MRQLTKQQKTLLAKTLKQLNKRDVLGELTLAIYTADDLSSDIWQQLEEIHDTEVLYQEVNRFISDYNSELVHR